MSRWVAAFLVYVIFALFAIENVMSIGVNAGDLQRQYLFGVPTRDIALAIALFVLVGWFAEIGRHVRVMHLGCVGTVCAGYLGLGIWNFGVSNQLNGDVRDALWFFGGLGVGFLVMRTSAARKHLQALLTVFTVCMVLASVLSADFAAYAVSGDVERVSHPEVYIFSGLMAGPIILVSNLSRPTLLAKALPIACVGAFALFSALLTGTRSQLIVTVGILILVLRSFNLRASGDVVVRSPNSVRKLAMMALVVAGVAYLAVRLDSSRLSRFATIAQPDILLSDPRVEELRSFLATSTPTQLFWGRGFGGTVASPIYGGENAPTMHIGIVNVWVKLGLVPFLIAAGWIYLVMPHRYLRSVRRLRRSGTHRRNRDVARVLVWPALLPWMLWSLLSGGFSEQDFLFLGLVYFMSSAIARSGLGRWSGVHSAGRPAGFPNWPGDAAPSGILEEPARGETR